MPVDECWECGEDPCVCEALQAEEREAAEAAAHEEDRALWMSGALEWRDRANDPGFAVGRWLSRWYKPCDKLHAISIRTSPLLTRMKAEREWMRDAMANTFETLELPWSGT